MLGGLKELFACFVDRDLLDDGPDRLCLPAILGSYCKVDRQTFLTFKCAGEIAPARSTWTETVTVTTGCRCSSVISIRMSVRGRTLHLEQSVPRQVRRGAHDLDLGRAEAAEIVANFVTVENLNPGGGRNRSAASAIGTGQGK